MIVKTWQVGNGEDSEIKERDVAEALRRLDPVGEEICLVERQRLVVRLIARADVAKGDVKVHLRNLETLRDELFPVEQARLLQLLVGRVDVSSQGVEVHLRAGGLKSPLAELKQDDEGRSVA